MTKRPQFLATSGVLAMALASTACGGVNSPGSEPDAGTTDPVCGAGGMGSVSLGTPIRRDASSADVEMPSETRPDVGTSAGDAENVPDAGLPEASAVGVDAGSDSGVSEDAAPGPPCAMGVDLDQMTLYSNPPDRATWPITTMLTEVDFTNAGVAPQFSKMDGPDRWPDVVPPGWGGPLQYTIGMAECIGGQWYASAVIEVWYGLAASGGNVAMNDQIAANWYYDAVRWGSLAGRQPATGEIIGMFVAAGNLRNITADDPAQSPVMERSNVVFMPMPDMNGSTNSF